MQQDQKRHVFEVRLKNPFKQANWAQNSGGNNMEVTAWKGATYGIRVGKGNVRQFFMPDTKTIEVEIGKNVCTFSLSSTFWTTCPKFREKSIGVWLDKNNLIPWPKGKPPKLRLLRLGKNIFRLTL